MKPSPPATLSREAKRVWKELRDEYDVVDSAGLQLLKVYAECYDRARKCRIQIDADGEIVMDRFDQKRNHPLLVAEKDARAQMLAALKQLNFDLAPLQDRPGRPNGR